MDSSQKPTLCIRFKGDTGHREVIEQILKFADDDPRAVSIFLHNTLLAEWKAICLKDLQDISEKIITFPSSPVCITDTVVMITTKNVPLAAGVILTIDQLDPSAEVSYHKNCR